MPPEFEFMPLDPGENAPAHVKKFHDRLRQAVPNQTEREALWNQFRSEILHRMADQDDQFSNLVPRDFKREHPERLRLEEILEQLADEWEANSWPPRS
jgi:hypothetical protein